MTLPVRPLGTTGLEITTVGFGSWAVGGGGWSSGWGPQDDERSIAAIHRAVGLGVNWVDTAAEYGLGHAEEVVREAVRRLPPADRPFVFTKGGLVWDPARPMVESRQVLRPDSIRRECEASLRRLGVDSIDLYQFHVPDETGTPVEESWGEMQRLIDEGKVRFGGVSNFDVALLSRCEGLRHVESLQPPLSLIERDAAAADVPWARDHGTGVICYSPMGSGMLTDSFSRERIARMADDDWRRADDGFADPALARGLSLRDALRPVAARHEASVAAVAIAWVLAWPGVTGAIVGARAPEQVEGWIGAASLVLSGGDLDEIAAAIAATGAGSGPARP
jgi:aryl-alcohol dehydrogenase-like predicted oxidoreductase